MQGRYPRCVSVVDHILFNVYEQPGLVLRVNMERCTGIVLVSDSCVQSVHPLVVEKLESSFLAHLRVDVAEVRTDSLNVVAL